MTSPETVAQAMYEATVRKSGSVHVASWDSLHPYWRQVYLEQATVAITVLRDEWL